MAWAKGNITVQGKPVKDGAEIPADVPGRVIDKLIKRGKATKEKPTAKKTEK